MWKKVLGRIIFIITFAGIAAGKIAVLVKDGMSFLEACGEFFLHAFAFIVIGTLLLFAIARIVSDD